MCWNGLLGPLRRIWQAVSYFRALFMTVTLKDGTQVQIDEQDAHILALPGWHIYTVPKSDLRYVIRFFKVNGKSKAQLLHRVILGVNERGTLVDHRDRNGLNNSRSNLRRSTHQQNLRNQYRKPDGKTSQFKGVYWCNRTNRWRARICLDGKRKSLGLHKNEVDAAVAYNKAASLVFGEFARLNDLAA